MALGMFGCVEEQAKNIAGQLGTTNGTRREEFLLLHAPQAAHGVVYGHVQQDKEFSYGSRRGSGIPLSTQGGKLFIPDELPPCIREEPVHTSRDVPKMKANRGCAARLIP
jgi:hypothetical protein